MKLSCRKSNRKILKLEKYGLQTLLDISESNTVTTFGSGRYVNEFRDIYIKILGMNVGWDNVRPVPESFLEQYTKIRLEKPSPSAVATGNLFADTQILTKILAAMVFAGGRSYVVGLFGEDIGAAERLLDSIKNCLKKTAEHLTKV